jgi:hypothetical protein
MSKPTHALVTPSFGTTDAEVGQKLTALYHEAQAAELAILRFGAAFWAVEQGVNATRGVNSPKRGPGSYGFANWLRDHAPEIAEGTARRYRDIAEATAERFKIEDPVRVFSLPAAELAPAEAKQQAKVIDFMAGHSMRGIQMELGLIDRPKPKKLPAEEEADRIKAEEAAYAARGEERPIDCVHVLTDTEREWWLGLTQPNRRAYNAWHPMLNFLTKDLVDQEFLRLPERDAIALKVMVKDLALALGVIRK